MTMLRIADLEVYYGVIRALRKVSLCVEEGEVVSVIGANGAGKSTLLRAIMGLVRSSGQVVFQGSDLAGLSTDRLVQKGLVMVPEGRRTFPLLSVEDNLELGAYAHRKEPYRREIETIYEMFPRLKERRLQKAGTLSGGEQQMLAIGRGLMSRPKMLLLDEPSMGLSPILVQQIFSTISRISQQGTTILLVEQNARAALRLSTRAYVLQNGEVVFSGSSSDVAKNPGIVTAYLGEA